jgi:hypothetical protein
MRNSLILCGLALFSIGCGGPRFVPVSGKVTLDDKPLANAMVGFYPLDAKAGTTPLTSSGRTNEQGEYTLTAVMSNSKGAVVGKHRVSITTPPDVSGGSDLPANKLPKGGKPPKLLPIYMGESSELSCEVPSGGKTDANFALKSR